MSTVSEIQAELKKLVERHDVGLVAYNCQRSQNLLGGEATIFNDIPQNPIKDKVVCNLCEQEVDEYYAWKLTWGEKPEQLLLDLCGNCNQNPAKNIWNYISKTSTETWGGWLTSWFYPNWPISYDFYFQFLTLSTERRSWVDSRPEV